MDSPLSGDCEAATRIEHLLHPSRGSQQVVLPRLVRNCVANPAHQPVPPALRHVLFLGPEEIQAWPRRQRRHQDEWIHPALVAAAVQARAIRQASRSASNSCFTRGVAPSRSFFPVLYGTALPTQLISRFRPPFDMSSSLGPKKYRRGRIGNDAIRMNGSTQLWWLKQYRHGPSGRLPRPSTDTRSSDRMTSVANARASQYRMVRRRGCTGGARRSPPRTPAWRAPRP